MRDIEEYFILANAVAKALNDAKVPPTTQKVNSLIVLIGAPQKPPLAGSINYAQESGLWEVEIELAQTGRIHGRSE